MSDIPITFTDRYRAAGIPYPDPQTMCEGRCAGMGFYPQFCINGQGHLLRSLRPSGEPTQYELDSWRKAHDAAHTIRRRVWNAIRFRRLSILWEKCNGYHFIKCPDCNGTGKRAVNA